MKSWQFSPDEERRRETPYTRRGGILCARKRDPKNTLAYGEPESNVAKRNQTWPWTRKYNRAVARYAIL